MYSGKTKKNPLQRGWGAFPWSLRILFLCGCFAFYRTCPSLLLETTRSEPWSYLPLSKLHSFGCLIPQISFFMFELNFKVRVGFVSSTTCCYSCVCVFKVAFAFKKRLPRLASSLLEECEWAWEVFFMSILLFLFYFFNLNLLTQANWHQTFVKRRFGGFNDRLVHQNQKRKAN